MRHCDRMNDPVPFSFDKQMHGMGVGGCMKNMCCRQNDVVIVLYWF